MNASQVGVHRFNDDLLLQDAERELAERAYPSVFHVLDHPELRNLFREYERPANRAKRNGLRAGLGAIGLGFMALAIAAFETTIAHMGADPHGAPTEPSNSLGIILAVASGLFGLLSFLIGSVGVLLARRKRDWLYNRLMGERIRQFHFQTFVFRVPQVLASLQDDAAKETFLAERKLWFDSFKARFVGRLDSAFTATVEADEDEELDPWLHDGAGKEEPASEWESRGLDPLFKAYRALRIVRQRDYVDHKLKHDHAFLSALPRRQLQIISVVSIALIIFLVVLHVGVLLGALYPNDPIGGAFHSPAIIVAIIWCALAALATRAVEQGLQPEREIERYQQYRSAVRAILDRYDEATTQAAKVEVMRQMERLAFDEMRNFLITNDRSRFVM